MGSSGAPHAPPVSGQHYQNQNQHNPSAAATSTASLAPSTSLLGSPSRRVSQQPQHPDSSNSSTHGSHSKSPLTSPAFQRNPSPPIPKTKKYIGHYDIADRTFQLLSRHRAAACILFWSLTILLDILLQLPIEWFFLFYFILALVFRIFFIGGHIVLISIGAMCVTNAIVFYTVPFSFTSPFATGVAFGLMVSLIHGLNLKGVILAMTMYMLKPYLERQTLIAALNPPTVPSIVFLAPLAAFCSAFGVLWLLYDLFGYLHASTDDLRDFFGLTLPAPSIVTLKDVKDRSVTLNWQCSSQATVSRHLIEIDGLFIGESGKQETSVVIQGLYPDNTYRIRLWAVTTRNWKTPSDYIVVRTLASVPVELELSSVENARRERELVSKSDPSNEDVQPTPRAPDLENALGSSSGSSNDRIDNISTTQGPISTDDKSFVSPIGNQNVVLTGTSANTGVSPDPKLSVSSVTDGQIATLRLELEEKESSHALLVLQLADLEKQYRQQEDSLKGEIAALREQQREEDEPRQQAKAKLKELQEILREAEANKTKVEKEHRIEVDKRRRISEQLQAKQKKLEALQQTLRQSGDKLKAEKEAHRLQRQELEAELRKRANDVKAAETAFKELQTLQKTLCITIDTKEQELQKLQTTRHSPKSHLVWEQKSKELDVKCAQLSEQLDQYRVENQQLHDRLAETTKSVTETRVACDKRRTEAKTRMASRQEISLESGRASYVDHRLPDHGSNWMGAGWNRSPGTKILNGLFQDDPALADSRPQPVRKTTGPPPGLSPKKHTAESSNAKDFGGSSRERDGKGLFMQGSPAALGSPFRLSDQPAGSVQSQQSNSTIRPPSSSKASSEFLIVDEPSNSLTTRLDSTNDSPLSTPSDGISRRQGSRSRTSSVSSLTGYQSPRFDSPFLFSAHSYYQQDSNTAQAVNPQTHQNRQSIYIRQQQQLQQQQQEQQQQLQQQQQKQQQQKQQQQYYRGNEMSPRLQFQGTSLVHSPQVAHSQSHWGESGIQNVKEGSTSMAVGSSSRSSLDDLERKSSGGSMSGQAFSYHRFFGPPSSADMPLGHFSEPGSSNAPQLDEQNVIKSMFEAPESLDLRHHLRTVGSHPTLATPSNILPAHLRSLSTPGSSSPLSSPAGTASVPFQSASGWDLKTGSRQGSLGRMNSQAEGSSSSLISDSSSPTSPHVSQFGPGFGRKSGVKDPMDRVLWGGYNPVSDIRSSRTQESGYGSVSQSQAGLSQGIATEDYRAVSKWNQDYFAPEVLTADDWTLNTGRPAAPDRQPDNLPNVLSNRESIIGKSVIDGMLPNPVGSSASTLSANMPMSADALAFADHYFSGRGHRSFEAPSSLSSTTFSTPAFKHISVDSGIETSKHDQLKVEGQGLSSITATSATVDHGKSDIFGYGLRLNPFDWSIPDDDMDEKSKGGEGKDDKDGSSGE
ncbi:hypothetical protein BG011_005139 [Mortierella polycephala]|uniref:Fibronectin type-III domain-containing protein n=1 Tax=Mortierella polycephala TaxID=41804 RepID=A0A9P6U9H5_9FUNG|nr:hypothetical protein BG011_005139 [Mortierella polycephala]